MMEESNWFQNLEGDIDSDHLDYLHSRLDAFRCRLFGEQPKEGSKPGLFFTVWSDKMPRLDVRTTDYGVFYSARRKWDDEFGDRRPGDNTPYEWHRINQFIFPFHTMITGGNGVVLRSFVPLDDEWAMLITQRGSLTERLYFPDSSTPTPLEAVRRLRRPHQRPAHVLLHEGQQAQRLHARLRGRAHADGLAASRRSATCRTAR